MLRRDCTIAGVKDEIVTLLTKVWKIRENYFCFPRHFPNFSASPSSLKADRTALVIWGYWALSINNVAFWPFHVPKKYFMCSFDNMGMICTKSSFQTCQEQNPAGEFYFWFWIENRNRKLKPSQKKFTWIQTAPWREHYKFGRSKLTSSSDPFLANTCCYHLCSSILVVVLVIGIRLGSVLVL